MKYLYYCNSTYQILTILNLHWHRKYASFENIENYEADIIILNSFSQAQEIASIIIDSKLFNNVWLVNKAFNSGKLHSLKTLIDFVKPEIYLKNNYGINKKDIYNKYSIICVPKYSTITAAIWRLNKNAELDIYEDGAGIYWGSINLKPDSRLYKMFYKEFNHGRDFYDLKKIYVNDSRLFAGIDGYMVVDIPSSNKDFQQKVSEMFKGFTEVDDLDGKNILYFAQYLNNKDINILIDNLLDDMNKYKKQVVYIPHPRHKDKRTYSFAYAKEKQIWELRISNINDIERKLLISIHSTACITPKILFDKEPYVLLFYDLCEDEVITRDANFDSFISQFINTYRDKNKIMIPKTKDELFDYIDSYIAKEGLNI